MYVITDAKLTLFKNKIYTVPLSFTKNHKYHSKRIREGHPNPMLSFLESVRKKVIAPQAHFDPVWGLAKWCVRRPFVTLACVSREFVSGNLTYDFF